MPSSVLLLRLSVNYGGKFMYRKISFLLLLFLFVSVLFSSCSNSKKDPSEVSNIYENNVSTSNNLSHLKYKLQDKLIVDADLNYEDGKTDYESYEAKLRVFDKENVRSVLMPEELVTDEFYEDAGEPLSRNVTTDYYLLENKDGASLGIAGTMLYYEKTAFDSIYYAFKIDRDSDLYNADKYNTNSNLDFMDRDLAFNKVKSILNRLNIDIDDDYTCYSLDNKTMTKQYHYIEMSDDDNHERTHTFKKSEECYCFVLSEKVDELSIAKFSYGDSESGTYVPGTEIIAFYGKEGLIMLDIKCPYDIVKTKGEESVLSLDEAINKLDNKYKSMIITDTIEVEKISLNYTAVIVDADKNEYTLVPSWVFEVTQKFSDHNESFSIMFNAITGEEFV